MQRVAKSSRYPDNLRFADFTVDTRAGKLKRNGIEVRLQDQPFQILAQLTHRAGEVVTRDELRRQVWPSDTFVDFDNSLNTAINKIREALGDAAEAPRFIETLPRRGYRFIAPVEISPSVIRLLELAPPAEPVKPVHRRWLIVPGTLLVVIALAGLGYWAKQHFAQHLTDKDTIVLADFENATGDPEFDDTLKQALAVQLQQSPFLSLISDQQARETMRFMDRSPNEHVVDAAAQEVCERQGGKAVLQGAIRSLGSHYVLTLNTVNCQTGASLGAEQAEVESKERVLAALGGMVSRMRTKLGESLAFVEKYDTPVEEATTSSLDALRSYSLGVNEQEKGNAAGAIPFLMRAIELDPRFALAYMRLYIADWDIGEYESGTEAATKAFELREHVSERERLAITALYHDIVTGDLEKVIQADELWARTYPREAIPHSSLAIDYSLIGSYERALDQSKEVIRLAPRSTSGYGNLAIAERGLNHWNESRAALEQLVSIGAESEAYCWLPVVAFAQGDHPALRKYLEIGAKKVQASEIPTFQFNQAGMAAFEGRLQAAREMVDAAVGSANQVGLKQNQPAMLAQEARWEAQMGNLQRAEQRATFAAKQARGIDVELNAALALALAGDLKSAKNLADDLERTHPQDTILHAVSMPLIQAAIALQLSDAASALKILKVPERYELGVGLYYFPALMPTYMRGQAYLKLRDGPRAAAEFQKILDHRGSGPTSLNYVLAQLGFGRANALAGNVKQAKVAYQDFFTLWKDADPDIPILREAKTEYAKLQ